MDSSPPRIEDDDRLGHEQNQAREQHVRSDHGWPVQAEVVVPIDASQNQSREKQK